MKKVGLYFGTFNPIHNGHIALGNYFIEYTDLDEVWFIVSPQNPFKLDQELLAENHRLEMVRLALENHPNLAIQILNFIYLNLVTPSKPLLPYKKRSCNYICPFDGRG